MSSRSSRPCRRRSNGPDPTSARDDAIGTGAACVDLHNKEAYRGVIFAVGIPAALAACGRDVHALVAQIEQHIEADAAQRDDSHEKKFDHSKTCSLNESDMQAFPLNSV